MGIMGPDSPGMGHNGGPRLAPEDPDGGWRLFCWRKAHKKAWKTPPREIALRRLERAAALLAMDLFNVHEMTDSGEVWALRRLERAEALGMTYRDYTLEILERGRHL